ncbi:unnamed protein product [Closterium sp. NIES-54]
MPAREHNNGPAPPDLPRPVYHSQSCWADGVSRECGCCWRWLPPKPPRCTAAPRPAPPPPPPPPPLPLPLPPRPLPPPPPPVPPPPPLKPHSRHHPHLHRHPLRLLHRLRRRPRCPLHHPCSPCPCCCGTSH